MSEVAVRKPNRWDARLLARGRMDLAVMTVVIAFLACWGPVLAHLSGEATRWTVPAFTLAIAIFAGALGLVIMEKRGGPHGVTGTLHAYWALAQTTSIMLMLTSDSSQTIPSYLVGGVLVLSVVIALLATVRLLTLRRRGALE